MEDEARLLLPPLACIVVGEVLGEKRIVLRDSNTSLELEWDCVVRVLAHSELIIRSVSVYQRTVYTVGD